MIKLIASDLDGTLFSKNHCLESDKNIKAVRRAIDEGFKVSLISARSPLGMIEAVERLGIDMPIIAFNGAFVGHLSNGAPPMYSRKMKKEDAVHVMNLVHKHNLYAGYYADMQAYYDKECEEVYAEASTLKKKPVFVDDLSAKEIPAPHKIIVIDFNDYETLGVLFNEITTQLPHLSVHYSETFCFDICEGGISKGTALRMLAEKEAIRTDEILAIGDNYNDISMFETAGIAVAMGNAPDAVKKAADWVVPTNEEDGVAVAIDRLLAMMNQEKTLS